MTLFIGLGNPGSEYEETRHNIGFKVIDTLIDNFKTSNISKSSFHGELYRSSSLLFLKPTTYMNLSGKSAQTVKQFFKVDLKNIIVVHDDIDLPFGAVRFKRGGGHGGHNGLKSLDTMITKEYIRVRIGVGKPEYKSQVSDYVLHAFTPLESTKLTSLIEHVSKSCTCLLSEDINVVKSLFSLKSIDGLQ